MNKKLNILSAAMLAISLSTSASAGTTTVAQWTFETTTPTTSGVFAPEVGNGSALGSHANTSAVYSSPVGNGSSHSFSSTYWAIGDYYQFKVSTAGLSNIAISWDQISSNTGPQNFGLSYSTDGVNFSSFIAYTVLANATPNTWSSSGTPKTSSSYSFDLSGVSALNNQANDYFRLVDTSTVSASGGAVSTGGTNRVDNFTVTAIAAVPEADTYALMMAGLGLVGMAARRRKA
jgi:hypothetical protein